MAAASRIFLPPSSPQLTVFKVLRSAVTGKSPPMPVATAPPTPAASALASSTTPPAAVDTKTALDKQEEMPRNPVLDALKPHIPMIRFRKGALAHATPSPSAAAPVTTHVAAASAASPAGSKADWSPKSTSVDWWETPNRYRRRELDDIEIEAINMGGADHLYR